MCQRCPGVRAARFIGDSISSAQTQIRNLPHSRSIWDVVGKTAKALPTTQKTSKSLSCPAYPWESLHTWETKGEPITAGIPWSSTAPGFLMSLRFVLGERRFGPMSAGARFIWIVFAGINEKSNNFIVCITQMVSGRLADRQLWMQWKSLSLCFWLVELAVFGQVFTGSDLKILLSSYSIYCWRRFWVSL